MPDSPSLNPDSNLNDTDNETMTYTTPNDYKTWARQERDRLLAEGASPDSVILMSEVRNHVPVVENDTRAQFAKRYSETMNDMIRRGVQILNDMCVADQAPDQFGTKDGRCLDLGPRSGATKGEYRDFVQWWQSVSGSERIEEVPERWRRFEIGPAEVQAE